MNQVYQRISAQTLMFDIHRHIFNLNSNVWFPYTQYIERERDKFSSDKNVYIRIRKRIVLL